MVTRDSESRLAEEDAAFLAAVRVGIAQADRGELIDPRNIVERIEKHLLR